jgi:hypothetical protein
MTVTVITELLSIENTEKTFNGPVYVVVVGAGVAAVALLPNPDLSFHVVIVAPFAAGTPVALGSEASNHKVHPGT